MNPLAEAHSHLLALKTDLPTGYNVEQTYVDEFHRILNVLQKAGHDLNYLRVPDNEMKRQSLSANTLTGEVSYTGKKVCSRSYLMMRIDDLLGSEILIFKSPRSKPPIGFQP